MHWVKVSNALALSVLQLVLSKHKNCKTTAQNFSNSQVDPSAAPLSPIRLAAVESGWRAGAPWQIRLAAAPIISGGGGGVAAAPAFRTRTDGQISVEIENVWSCMYMHVIMPPLCPTCLLCADFYRAMHFSAYARSWDRMSSVCPSVHL